MTDEAVSSGIQTEEVWMPWRYGFKVRWISWSSGFRDSGLVPGDLIIGVDGARYDRSQRTENDRRAIGRHQEARSWPGAKDGHRVRVLVKRRRDEIEIEGELRAEQRFTDATGRKTLGPGGPATIERDGFYPGWESWAEKLVYTMGAMLGDGWRTGSVSNSRVQHATLEQERPRIEALLQRYPGPFATAMAADFERTVACLRGRRYELVEEDFAFRRLGEQRVEDIRERARAAWAEAQARVAAERIEPFPTIDPIHGDRASVAGKVVVLPPLTGRDVIVEANRGWNVAGDPRRGHYFVDRQGPAMTRMFDAEFRYKRAVTGRIKDERTILGRIGPDPQLLVKDGRPLYGLEVVPEGVLSGDQLFIDLATIDADGESPFAGEDTLMRVQDIPIPDDASPRMVMEAFYRALKLGAEKVWSSLYANWHATRYDTHPAYNALWSIPSHWFQTEWVRARNRLLEKLYDVRAVDEGEPYVLLQQDELPGAPLIEEVEVEVEHVGRFGDEYLSFKEQGLNTLWHLQRVSGGPWRIAWHNGRHSI